MVQRKQGKWSRRSEGGWRALLAKFDGSGLGVEAFCRREAISAASFYRWRNLLASDAGGGAEIGSAASPAFVDLGTLGGASSRRPGLELTLDLGAGLVLRLVRN